MSLTSKAPPLPPEVAAELEAAMGYDKRTGGRLGLKMTREWFEKMAALEGDLEVGAGDGTPPTMDEANHMMPLEVERAPLEKALAPACYIHSGGHLSGFRLCIGFETLEQAQAAHEAVAKAVNS